MIDSVTGGDVHLWSLGTCRRAVHVDTVELWLLMLLFNFDFEPVFKRVLLRSWRSSRFCDGFLVSNFLDFLVLLRSSDGTMPFEEFRDLFGAFDTASLTRLLTVSLFINLATHEGGKNVDAFS